MEQINIEKLRQDLIDYFLGAYFIVSPIAIASVSEIENASEEELIKIALENKFDLRDYIEN